MVFCSGSSSSVIRRTQLIEAQEIIVSRGAVATEAPEAARIGAAILERGGNAMDAAAAASLATGVLVPFYCDIGGYGFSGVVLEAVSDRVWSLDANSVAPAAARSDMFQIGPKIPGRVGLNENEYDCSLHDDANLYGPLAVGPPGFMAGVGLLWEKWGRLKWSEIIEPSVALLETGFRYGDAALEIQRCLHVLQRFPPALELLAPGGRRPQPADIWHRTGLETTLVRLAATGWRDFYSGAIGRQIGDYVYSLGGIMTRHDMAAYQPRISVPLETAYRGAAVYGPVLPNGSLSCMQILNLLECFEPLPLEAPRYWHRLAEVLKLAWRDRLRYLADPEFADVPTARLLDRHYAAEQVAYLLRHPEYVDRTPPPNPAVNSAGTANISAADAEGNLVAVTLSQGNPFGSCIAVPGAGFTLGHGMCRFDPRPGRPNSIAPGKRPLNNFCSLLLRLPDRDIALGMQGGRRMVSVIPQAAHRMVEFGLSPRQAAESPRIHTLGYEPIECEQSPPFPYLDALRRLGHDVRPVEEVGRTLHIAERFHASRKIRAGGSTGAAGC